MSRVFFHSLSRQAELWGGEYEYLRSLVTNSAVRVSTAAGMVLCNAQ